jgi:hypothetical protein
MRSPNIEILLILSLLVYSSGIIIAHQAQSLAFGSGLEDPRLDCRNSDLLLVLKLALLQLLLDVLL